MARFLVVALALILPCASAPAQKAPASRPEITGISHVTLYADDISKSREFYGSLLGWDQVPAGEAFSGVRFYANHAQYIELLSPPQRDLADRLVRIGFATSNAEGLRKYLGASGVSVPEAVTLGPDGSRSFLVHDGEGNQVDFTQAGGSPARPETASRRLSPHIIHAGYEVRDRAALDHFYRDLLGFALYWQGGAQSQHIDWVMMQVPNGTDWLEYMLNLPSNASRRELAGANHFAPGVTSVAELQLRLQQRGWRPAENKNPQLLGVDGKWQLDLFDPDGTRVEFMEFRAVKKPCCALVTGREPSSSTAW